MAPTALIFQVDCRLFEVQVRIRTHVLKKLLYRLFVVRVVSHEV